MCAPPEAVWHYGGIGLMIDQPGWNFHISKSETDSIQASAAISSRISRVLEAMRQEHSIPAVKIIARSEVAPHTGLGSGTQLALAIGSGLSVLTGTSRAKDSSHLSTSLNRNRRSGVGTFGFDKGGFIIDRGRSALDVETFQRTEFPEEWRLVLLAPNQNEGLSGNSEESFFGQQPFLEHRTVSQLAHLIEQQIVTAIEQQDLPGFAAAIAEYGQVAGAYYAKVQGGIFSSQLLSDVVRLLEEQGIAGAAQSSWGPTVCIPAESAEAAIAITKAITKLDADNQIDVVISRPLNTGATIRSTASEDQRSFG